MGRTEEEVEAVGESATREVIDGLGSHGFAGRLVHGGLQDAVVRHFLQLPVEARSPGIACLGRAVGVNVLHGPEALGAPGAGRGIGGTHGIELSVQIPDLSFPVVACQLGVHADVAPWHDVSLAALAERGIGEEGVRAPAGADKEVCVAASDIALGGGEEEDVLIRQFAGQVSVAGEVVARAAEAASVVLREDAVARAVRDTLVGRQVEFLGDHGNIRLGGHGEVEVGPHEPVVATAIVGTQSQAFGLGLREGEVDGVDTLSAIEPRTCFLVAVDGA